MKLSSSKDKAVVGLDIEGSSLAAAEVSGRSGRETSQVVITPISSGLIKEGEVVDEEGLGAALRAMFAEHKMAKDVRVGTANQRVAVRTLQLPLIEDPKELETAVRFQAKEHLPMPLDQAVLDCQVISRFDREDGSKGMEVVAVAARRDMVEKLLAAIKGAGLRPVGIDLSAFAMIRALSPHLEQNGADGDETTEAEFAPAILYCNLGDVTNLAVARRSSCLFTRISPYGFETLAQRLAERRGLTLEHSRQWLTHVGLEKSAAEIEGDPEIVSAAREALEEGAAKLTDELRLSLEFYGAQGVPAVERVVVTGPGSVIPGLVSRLEAGLDQPFSVVLPDALAQVGDQAAARLSVAYGLALEE